MAKGQTIVAGKVKIRKISSWSMAVTVALTCVCVVVSAWGYKKYTVLRGATQDYIDSESAAQQLRAGSDYLTKQARLAAATGEQQYIDAYFEEANVARRREKALEKLAALHGDPEAAQPLQDALSASVELMQTEFYAMRLVEEAVSADAASWPEELRNVALSASDALLSGPEKLVRAREMVIGTAYEASKDEINGDVDQALEVLSKEILDRQYRAADSFSGVFRMIVFCILLFGVMMLLICLIMRYWIVKPLLHYTRSIQNGLIAPVGGVNELQLLAKTYNSVYEENAEREALMKHQAEHDPLTQLLNRGAFDRILELYLKDQSSFALILADVDTFKQVNDTYGHAVGDAILKKVARYLTEAFRSIDYVCRIGGDEFAIIMVDMTFDLVYTIPDKIRDVNKRLAVAEEGVPQVSLSVGAAFTDRLDGQLPLFKAADLALYHTKEHGRRGCTIYPMDGGDAEQGKPQP